MLEGSTRRFAHVYSGTHMLKNHPISFLSHSNILFFFIFFFFSFFFFYFFFFSSFFLYFSLFFFFFSPTKSGVKTWKKLRKWERLVFGRWLESLRRSSCITPKIMIPLLFEIQKRDQIFPRCRRSRSERAGRAESGSHHVPLLFMI